MLAVWAVYFVVIGCFALACITFFNSECQGAVVKNCHTSYGTSAKNVLISDRWLELQGNRTTSNFKEFIRFQKLIESLTKNGVFLARPYDYKWMGKGETVRNFTSINNHANGKTGVFCPSAAKILECEFHSVFESAYVSRGLGLSPDCGTFQQNVGTLAGFHSQLRKVGAFLGCSGCLDSNDGLPSHVGGLAIDSREGFFQCGILGLNCSGIGIGGFGTFKGAALALSLVAATTLLLIMACQTRTPRPINPPITPMTVAHR